MIQPAVQFTGTDFSSVVEFVRTHQRIRWIFSDVDGTLMKTSAVVDLYVSAARSLGITLTPEAVSPWLGKIAIQDPLAAAKTIFSKHRLCLDDITAIIRRYERDFLQTPAGFFQHYVYQDIPPSLAALQRLGVGLGIITNRYEAMAFQQIRHSRILKFVACHPSYTRTEAYAVCGGDTLSLEAGEWQTGKTGELQVHLHHLGISPEDALVVGDTPSSDIMAAQTLGIASLLLVRVKE